MSANVKFVIDLIIGLAPLLAGIVAIGWRTTAKLNDNTAAVREMAGKIDGTPIDEGLTKRVRALEDWRLTQETRRLVAQEKSE